MIKYYAFALVFVCACRAETNSDPKIPQSLSKASYTVCGQNLKLEEATTAQQHSIGLMGRSALEEGSGMMFIFPREKPRAFWMKNVPFDIEIGYFNKDQQFVSWTKMLGTTLLQLEQSLPSYPSASPAKFAIETPVGFFSSLDSDVLKKCTFKKLI